MKRALTVDEFAAEMREVLDLYQRLNPAEREAALELMDKLSKAKTLEAQKALVLA